MTGATLVTKDDIAVRVVQIVEDTHCTYFEALNEVVDEFGIEIEEIKHYISDPLKVKLEAEAGRLNLLNKKVRTKRLF